ncbi:MAG: hypothetical protein R3D03_11220 [Geminicoccaceae bacterium]
MMVSKRDVQTFDDIQDQAAHALPTSLPMPWTHLGADVKTLAWTDVYQAIDKGIVEAGQQPDSTGGEHALSGSRAAHHPS